MFVKLLIFSYFLAGAEELNPKLGQAEKAIQSSHKEAQKSQEKINKLDDQKVLLLEQYRSSLKQTENLRVYNQELRKYIKAQKQEILDTRKKILQVKDTKKEVVPLMLKMLSSLEQFIDLDLPFLIEKRKQHIQDLKNILDRSDVSASEKYRQLIAIYELEQEYGRTLQSYKGLEQVKGKQVTVEYLRVGRLAFIYKSLDNKHLAFWNPGKKSWEKLGSGYKRSVSEAIKIAKKQSPPELIRIPLLGLRVN